MPRPDPAPADKLLEQVVMRPIVGVPAPGWTLFATHEGEFEIAGKVLKVYQLSNGQRVIDADSLKQFFGLT